MALLPPKLSGRLTRALPLDGEPAGRAWLRLDPHFGAPVRHGDVVFDVPNYLGQFI